MQHGTSVYQGVVGVEEHIASISDVFEISGEAESTEAAKRSFPSQRRTAIVLAGRTGTDAANHF